MLVFVTVATVLILLRSTLRRRLTRRLNPRLGRRCCAWLRWWRPEFLNWRTRWLSPLLRHGCRSRSTEFLGRRARRFDTLQRHFAYRWWRLTFHALNIRHFPTLLSFLRRRHRAWLACLGAHVGHRYIATGRNRS
jgi:hypothetical protein